MSKILVAACLATAAVTAASAQDVRSFSREEAEGVLADPTPAAVPDACQVRLPNGSCARTSQERGFSIARTKPQPAAATTATTTATGRPNPGLTTSGARTNAQVGRSRLTESRPPRVAGSREVPLRFGLGSVELSPQSRANLQTLALAMNKPENRAKRLLITGHTDSLGSLDSNRRLSQQRADAVASFLAGQGVERSRLDAQGRAFDTPLPGLSARDARNRRVEVARVD